MGGFASRFTSFDKLIGPVLIKVLYWIGVVGIALGVAVGIIGALASFRYSPEAAVVGIVSAPIGGVIGLIFWRFLCELYIVLFRISEDISVMKVIQVRLDEEEAGYRG